jgi:type IV pilus assembly protein PilB
MELLPLHSNEPRLAALIRRYYEPIETQPILDEAPPDEERAAIALVESIINEAIQLHASDIHFQPTRQDLQVRYRIDGVLEERASHPRSLLAGVVGRMKVLGQLDIAEHRVPQDGGHRWTYEGHKVDLRISIMPTVYGESIVIRILDAMIGMRRLDDIGFRKEDEDRLRDLLQRRDGLILVTGPTGSGKSTTLYAALATLNQEELNIMTVENPVEYHLSGIKQIEVNPTAGYDFARALRSILRHDPDVILIGEIRDHETLQIALESALTGHLVLSTLHTNNAASTLARLLEMGAPDYLIRDTLRGVLAQRLVRLNCTHCLEPESITVELRNRLKLDSSFHSKHGTGCDHCRNTGYSGRTAVYELLEVTDSIRDQLTSGVSSIKIESQAIEEGMTTLRENALYLVEQGLTSLSELQRAGLI